MKKTENPSITIVGIIPRELEKIHPFSDGNGRVGRFIA